jgi:D-glycero-D-manno-heptose 1,7-bisphosphate phosphatase
MIMKQPAVFFDRDGVLNVDKHYVYRIEDFEWIPGAIDSIKLANSLQYRTFIVTNQSGIARGYYTINAMEELHNWMLNELNTHGAKIDHVYYCPYNDTGVVSEFVVDDHPDRKPNPGMIEQAIQDFNISRENSFIIGDKQSDLEAGRRANIRGFLYSGGNLYDQMKDILCCQ